MANLLSESEVLNKIGATDFRSINKKQLVEFISSIPDMDKEVAMKCIDQFPEFQQQATTIVKELYKMCESIDETHKAGQIKAMDAYQSILDSLSRELDKPEISYEQKQELISTMVDVADKIAELQREGDNFLEKVLQIAGLVATFAIGVGGAILGVKIGFFNKNK